MTENAGEAALADRLARFHPALEAALQAGIPSESITPDLFDILRYHLGWLAADFTPVRASTGKRLRPLLCLLACEAAGGEFAAALPAAVAVELLHNFSLIHDDIEDRGPERRGRPTVWARWGEPLAVNAGDALLILSELALLAGEGADGNPSLALVAARQLNQCCLRLTEGQHLDLTLEGRTDLRRDDYIRLIGGKTAALLGCAAELGARFGGASPAEAEHYRAFGENLGLGFQMQDDVLGIWGLAAETGKSAAADVYGRKVTLPVIQALAQAEPADRARLEAVYQSKAPTPEQVAEVVTIFDRLGVRGEIEAAAQAYVERAVQALNQAAPRPQPASALRWLAYSLLGRTT
jgi:geranylgeranyl diphosphate synthase type I